MPMQDVSISPTVRRRRLSRLLSRMRKEAELSPTAAAARLGWDRTKLSRVETGEQKTVRPAEVDQLLDLYRIVDEAERSGIHELARDAKTRGWWSRYRDVFGESPLPDFEAEAVEILTYEATAIPGLLQTPNYAEAVFLGGRNTTTEQARRQVEARMERREILTHFSPPSFIAVIDEAALHRTMGSQEIMREQLEYVLHITSLPNISLQVLPYSAGSHPALSGAFTILHFQDPDPTIVYMDVLEGGGLFEQGAQAVAEYNETFEHVKRTALHEDESTRFIEQIIATGGVSR